MLRRVAAGTCAMVLVSSTGITATEPSAKAGVYCTQAANGEWGLQRFKPLIRSQGGTVFAEMSFAGNVLTEIRVRRFMADSELAYDYRFDVSGRLTLMRGSVTVKTPPITGSADGEKMLFADWVGVAELTPDAEGKIPAHHVLYRRETDRIDKPDDADKYIAQFNEAPVYKTVQSVPCAAMLKEAEKMNATQG